MKLVCHEEALDVQQVPFLVATQHIPALECWLGMTLLPVLKAGSRHLNQPSIANLLLPTEPLTCAASIEIGVGTPPRNLPGVACIILPGTACW
jgi:hypothetical protein